MSEVVNEPQRLALKQILRFMWAISIAFLLGILLLWIDGYSPGDAFSAALWGSVSSSYRTANMMARIMTITLAGLAAAIPFIAGVWNIGGDGQITVGAFAAAYVGISLTGLPTFVHLSLAISAAMLAGAVWAAIPAFLLLKYKANEIVTTIMMNYVAFLLTDYFVNYPFKEPGSACAQTVRMPESATLSQLVPMSNLNMGIFIALAAFIVIVFFVRRTIWGYEWRILGSNEQFGRYGGIKSNRMRFLSMCVGGALAGLAGSILVLGVFHRFLPNISGGVGFNGVLIALIAANSPLLVLVVASIFGWLQSGVIGMESKMGITVQFSDILQSMIILMVIIRDRLWKVWGVIRMKRRESKQ